MNIIWNNEDYLMHYGMPRRSGRYPWGSGKNPFHHGADRKTRKKQKIERKMDKRIAKNTKYMNKHIEGLTKRYNKGRIYYEDKKDLSRDINYWKHGYSYTNNFYKKLKDVKMRSIDDKRVKKTAEYKRLSREFAKIKISEIGTNAFLAPGFGRKLMAETLANNEARRRGLTR